MNKNGQINWKYYNYLTLHFGDRHEYINMKKGDKRKVIKTSKKGCTIFSVFQEKEN